MFGKPKNQKNLDVFEIPELDNSCKTLVANISFASLEKPVKTICVTSSIPNEGKSAIAANLACAFANAGKTTLIVECDMRRRTLAGRLHLRPEYGIFNVLNGDCRVEDAIYETHIPNLYFLDSESDVPNPPAVLQSRRFKSLIAYLRKRFDYVIFDTPPTTTFPDSSIVGALADGTVFVLRQNFTKRKDVKASLDQLRQANANLLGTAFSFVERESGNYYYYTYYSKDGKRIRKDSSRRVDSSFAHGNLGDTPSWVEDSADNSRSNRSFSEDSLSDSFDDDFSFDDDEPQDRSASDAKAASVKKPATAKEPNEQDAQEKPRPKRRRKPRPAGDSQEAGEERPRRKRKPQPATSEE